MNIKKKRNLGWWEFPNTTKVEINGIEKQIPELTEDNFWTLVDDYNALIKNLNDAIDVLTKEIKDLKSSR